MLTKEIELFGDKRPEKEHNKSAGCANRKIQDSMFTDLFSSKKNLLDLYQSLHPEDKSVGLKDIKNVTLTNILIKGLPNDLGLMVRDKLIILTEHQSTVNKNMPVRTLLYYADELKRYLFADEERKRQLYRSGMMKLPSPEFYVVYTGGSEEFDGSELRLSDAFDVKGFMEIKVKVLLRESIDKNSILGKYLEFVRRLKENMLKYEKNTEKAIMETVKECITDGILDEYLQTKKGEIAEMLLEEMSIEEIVGTAEENRAEGRAEGREEGREEGIKGMVRLCKELGGSFTDVVDQIASSFSLTREDTERRVRKYW